MILKYKGKYSGDESTLPQRKHPEGYVQFKEPEDMKKLAVIANAAAAVITVLFAVAAVLRVMFSGTYTSFWDFYDQEFIRITIGIVLSVVAMVPHEFLHALCFKDEVWMFQNLSQGLLFVVGDEDMSKSRFVFMSMLPNLVFGFIPFIIFMIDPELTVLAGLSVISIGAGAGDYLNVFNCLTQVPKGAKVYMSGMHSYWYMPR